MFYFMYSFLFPWISSVYSRSTVVDSTGLNSTEFDESDGFFDAGDRHRGRLPSQLSSSGLGGAPIKNINSIFHTTDE